MTPIALGDPPLLNAGGLHAPFALRLVIELVTECGRTGLGELPGDLEILNGLRRAAPALAGLRIHDLPAIAQVIASAFGGNEERRGDRPWDGRHEIQAFSGLEMACLDATARRLECRVADLLGGARRSRVPFAGYLFFKYAGSGGGTAAVDAGGDEAWATARRAEALDPAGLVRQAQAMVGAFGFGSLKVKAGILDPAVEVGAVLALRETFGGGMPIRIDPNAAWGLETALQQGRRLRGIIEYYEDPVRGQEEMARLRGLLDVPLATNMCTTSFADLPSSFSLQSEDIILADPHYWGGLRATMDLARICGTFDRGLSMHSNSHAGISLAAMVQVGAALPAVRYALDTHYPWQADEVIAGGRLAVIDGSVGLPDGPGLGVTLDRQALARLHAQYLTCGLLRRDDEREMRNVDPGWRFQPTRY